jgi:hypothetical protein
MTQRDNLAPISRRQFVASTTAVGVLAGVSSASPQAVNLPPAKAFGRDWSKVRGFNYQPSYGSSGFELWQRFDPTAIDRELALGRKYFPRMNALRWWLSWDSFKRNPKRFADRFETTLTLASKHGAVVMPVLFNRWHDAVLDYGGTYIDHFLPGVSWVQTPGLFDEFMDRIVGGHKDDPRILAWDLCNEPYSYGCPREKIPQIVETETAWLRGLYQKCKALGAKAPVTVGIHPGVPLAMVEPFADLLSIHPYFVHNDPNARKNDFEAALDRDVAIAVKARKPLLATECCWGALDDKVRVESLRYTLEQLKKRGIGWLVYLLHHSLIADAHRPEFGPVGFPGYLGFIEHDGRLRPGHDAFNEY